MESKYAQDVLERFKTTFHSTWIESLKWSASARSAFAEGMREINDFREDFVVQLLKLILSGDHLINDTNSLDTLLGLLNERIEDVDPRRTLKIKLTLEYQSMLTDLIDAIRLVKNNITFTKKKLQPNNVVISGNFIPLRKNGHKLVQVVNLACDSCADEYNFSYDDTYIRQLLWHRQCLSDCRKGSQGNLRTVLNAVYSKIELLLGKLSALSENKRISYYHDLQLETIELEQCDKYDKYDFRFLFQKYLDPSKLDNTTILEWQQESLKENVPMWQLAFLMRYYTKCTKCISQIDDLLNLACRHHDEYIKSQERNVVNDCSDRSFLNYMYNSRFSFLCHNEKTYSYDQMRADLANIDGLQAQTFVMNYHPYQTAIDFTIQKIEAILSRNESEDISDYVFELKEYFRKFKSNIEWCKKYQPYLVQLRFNFSSITFDGCDFKTFCPSSFCRPLRFKDLDEKVIAYASKIANLEHEARNQSYRQTILAAKSKIDNMERKNMEQMGLFITITTFLVGLLSIFIGNDGSVSITEKMRYVVALGCILIVFVCLGYFAVRDKYDKRKCWLFGLLIFASVLSIACLCWQSSKEHDVQQKASSVKQKQVENPKQVKLSSVER